MTLNEQKLAVCKKLPELIHIQNHRTPELPLIRFYWKPYKRLESVSIYWQYEGLQVCHEAEKLLDSDKGEMMFYQRHLQRVSYPVYHATYEQRLKALCQVWWPKRFK